MIACLLACPRTFQKTDRANKTRLIVGVCVCVCEWVLIRPPLDLVSPQWGCWQCEPHHQGGCHALFGGPLCICKAGINLRTMANDRGPNRGGRHTPSPAHTISGSTFSVHFEHGHPRLTHSEGQVRGRMGDVHFFDARARARGKRHELDPVGQHKRRRFFGTDTTTSASTSKVNSPQVGYSG
jgi:hypothetical protein